MQQMGDVSSMEKRPDSLPWWPLVIIAGINIFVSILFYLVSFWFVLFLGHTRTKDQFDPVVMLISFSPMYFTAFGLILRFRYPTVSYIVSSLPVFILGIGILISYVTRFFCASIRGRIQPSLLANNAAYGWNVKP